MKYRKKPLVIEAIQWDGKNERKAFDFLTGTENYPIALKGNNFRVDLCNGSCMTGDLYIKTLEGEAKATIGDYIIRGVNGEYYPCKPDIFEKTYEKAEE
jgi:hypothetical protein